jgi:hypothetical protein
LRRFVPAKTRPTFDHGHALVIHESESVCDPSPETPNSFAISKLFGRLESLGHRVECVCPNRESSRSDAGYRVLEPDPFVSRESNHARIDERLNLNQHGRRRTGIGLS